MGALWATGRPIEALGGGSAIRAFENAPGGELPGLPFPGRSPVHGRGQWPCHSRKRKRSGDGRSAAGVRARVTLRPRQKPVGRRKAGGAFQRGCGDRWRKHRRPIRQRPLERPASGRRTCDCGWKLRRGGRGAEALVLRRDSRQARLGRCHLRGMARVPGATGRLYRSVRLQDGAAGPREGHLRRPVAARARRAGCPPMRGAREADGRGRGAEDHRQQGDELYGECVPPDPPHCCTRFRGSGPYHIPYRSHSHKERQSRNPGGSMILTRSGLRQPSRRQGSAIWPNPHRQQRVHAPDRPGGHRHPRCQRRAGSFLL